MPAPRLDLHQAGAARTPYDLRAGFSGNTVDYTTVKAVHVASVIASYCLFSMRGYWMVRGSTLLQARWTKIVPHVVDTVLLASAITLAVLLRAWPLDSPWLAAKIVGLVVYVVLGTIALKRGKTLRGRVAALIAAQAVFFYIVAVAVTKNPWPFGWHA